MSCARRRLAGRSRESALSLQQISTRIIALQPDLVLAFSDLQAGIAADLIRRGLEVHAFNQRTVAGILDMIRMVGAIVASSERADGLIGGLEPEQLPRRNGRQPPPIQILQHLEPPQLAIAHQPNRHPQTHPGYPRASVISNWQTGDILIGRLQGAYIKKAQNSDSGKCLWVVGLELGHHPFE
jgi:hypothetical protein